MNEPRTNEPRANLFLILGGARSGKSAYAERLAARVAQGRPVVYVATARASDDEMRARIARHRAERPTAWRTLEAPEDPAAALAADPLVAEAGVALLDCVTLLVSNLTLAQFDGAPGEQGDFDEARFDAEAAEARVWNAVERLLDWYRRSGVSLILVSNEVGLGLVPPYRLGRVYRDILGRVNTRLAAEAGAAALLVAGQPLDLKALAAIWEARLERLLAPVDDVLKDGGV